MVPLDYSFRNKAANTIFSGDFMISDVVWKILYYDSYTTYVNNKNLEQLMQVMGQVGRTPLWFELKTAINACSGHTVIK